MASEFPFWDDVCLRGSIDLAPLASCPRSLFDNDLFCDEAGVEDHSLNNFPDILPPLPTSSPPIPSPTLQPLTNSNNISEDPESYLCSPPSHLDISSIQLMPPAASMPPPLPTLPSTLSASSPSSLINNRNSNSRNAWGSFLDDGCPLRKRVKVTIVPSSSSSSGQVPITSTIPRNGKKEKEVLYPSTLPRVPIIKNHIPPQAVVKKPRNSQMRVSAPRRTTQLLQTTFRIARPGDPSASIKLDIPLSPLSLLPLAKRKAEDLLVDQPASKRDKLDIGVAHVTESQQKKHLAKIESDIIGHDQHLTTDEFLDQQMDDVDTCRELLALDEDEFIMSLHDENTPPIISPSPVPSTYEPEVKTESKENNLKSSNDLPVTTAIPARKRRVTKNGTIRKGRNHPKSFITASLQNRLSSMITTERPSHNILTSSNILLPSFKTSSSQPSRSYSSLPLVDAAVQAVARAAREYSEKLACSFPVSASAAASIVGLPHQQHLKPLNNVTSKKRTKQSRRRRVLLSFDDKDVKPLIAEENTTAESALAGFLNCPSPCSKKVSSSRIFASA